jgi:pantoate--beta-alanine ligase
MKLITSISDMHSYIDGLKRRGNKKNPVQIGFVPTMGFLHAGHISLVAAAARDNKKVVVSIFVNPTQFGPGEDFEAYPRDTKKDLKMLKETKQVDCVFMPEAKEMYPDGYATYLEVGGSVTKGLDSDSRPGHFRGVATVVAKFLNIVKPDRMYLGQKDAQQVTVLKKMASEMNYNTELVICPIVREKDGLAMSSRNAYLNPEERNTAPALRRALQMAESMIELGERDMQVIIKEIKRKLTEEKVKIDYVEIVDAETLEPKKELSGKILLAAAIFVGKTRLIDNSVIEIK